MDFLCFHCAKGTALRLLGTSGMGLVLMLSLLTAV